MGVFILVLSFVMLEGWLNYTGYIFKVLWATNFAEPFNFIIAPLIYLFGISQFKGFKKEKQWLHFLPFLFWLGYCVFFFIQSDVFKYNSNIAVMQLDVPYLNNVQKISDDPLHIRTYINIMTGISFVIYNIFIVRLLLLKAKSLGKTIFNTKNKTLISLRNSLAHFLIIIIIFIFVKLTFKNDVGDYFIFLYLSFMFFMAAIQIMNSSDYYNQVSSFLEVPTLKYIKSSLDANTKEIILNGIVQQMKVEKYFIKSTASLSGLAKSISESSHHVSQVINEKLNQSFFEMLASYRVEEAKAILKTELGKKLTIEEIAEQVGYNSKSAFNTAFKKITSQTPSEFRDI
jgi:YesN/AraC family two-component response regulator